MFGVKGSLCIHMGFINNSELVKKTLECPSRCNYSYYTTHTLINETSPRVPFSSGDKQRPQQKKNNYIRHHSSKWACISAGIQLLRADLKLPYILDRVVLDTSLLLRDSRVIYSSTPFRFYYDNFNTCTGTAGENGP